MVPSTFLRSKPARCLPVLLATLLFAGCGTHTQDQSTAFMQGTSQANSSFYLQQMQQSTNDSKTNWQLLAIRALLQEGKKQQAIDLYNQLPSNLNSTQAREQSLLAVEVKLAQGDYQGAKALLSKLDPLSFEKNQQPRYWQAQIDASQGQPSLSLLRALIAQQPLLSQAKQKQQNIDATWKALTAMTPQQANALVINADENVLQGWLDLQRMWFDNRNDPAMLKAGVKDWQIRYPQNPGAQMLPTALVNMQNYKPASTNKIALLLPLNGQAAIFGRTIQQGFEAAKNGAPAVQGSAVPAQVAQAANVAGNNDVVSPSQAEVGDLTATGSQAAPAAKPAAAPLPAPVAATPAAQPAAQPVNAPAVQPQPEVATTNPAAELKIYDTTSQPMSQLLAQVQQDGATIVVGPLLKENVEEVMKSNTSLNVLALNQPGKVENRPNLCYFALSPEDEARDAARHIHDQGKQTPLLLVPRGALGDRVVSAFADEWLKLGGGTVLQQRLGSTAELKSGVNGGGISLTGSPVSTQPSSVDSSLGNPGDVPVSSGGSIDAAYIVATPEQIGYIKPLIAMRNGSQSNVTLYASSRSAQGTSGPDFRLEMEGLQYSEIPMLAGSNPALMQQALSAVRNDYSLARLYAMGADAWSLANHFAQMRQSPGYELNGNTGDLTATPDCVINRKLSWLKYQQGQIVAAN
ncbi:penicillin-binding protein activator [Klebsiella aerogenes]|uniref:Penicillin-binding protein activator LpoA n=1 Tax=Klebsiella aerogenes (strain ATCC 13048 / DSM 30053 / CCUG 1429 / JCM 1235 / KCTC 2190 / NBRC 13534 / NCIMB 10102 / NCTC 10006 / CDC 819-56) TaxID=1028307 RepID=A0A0H3FSI4_KLEAK|nr:penicillin-binding protein activator [Klebsiella aerogenes]AEG95763.1 LppC family lipoprotein [Klebsiella aerogenes KCTC 2190]EKZ6375021.1 penicillin-binding protein activator [Klebsiella aerogenes]EMF0924296.1 penicillin-binding protein activator [Klebsiella aerogenes]KLF32478.1 penicillin-binding protein [Klebsiella aerogenes]KLF37368.1 penicillin-binding protein [Klebsiella aerogenes]